jgi:riboflavin synthase
MFTGIVQGKAVVRQINALADFRRLRIELGSAHLQQLQRGASIAINGTCLTATDFDTAAGWVEFDVIDETLQKTNLGLLQVGSLVNFERSLKFGDEIGGHLVSGHIQGLAVIAERRQTPQNLALALRFPAELAPYIHSKGFIAVEGCSLTVGQVDGDVFWLHLIPETLALTTLAEKQPGERLNLEVDQQTVTIVQTVERYLAQRQRAV